MLENQRLSEVTANEKKFLKKWKRSKKSEDESRQKEDRKFEDGRRLCAIMITDIVGYSALSQENETHSLEVLQKHNSLLREFFRKYGGVEVKTMGDSWWTYGWLAGLVWAYARSGKEGRSQENSRASPRIFKDTLCKVGLADCYSSEIGRERRGHPAPRKSLRYAGIRFVDRHKR